MPDPQFGPFGGIVLDGVRFTTDPKPYEPLNWPKRFSEHRGIGGKVTLQDFGTFMKDNKLKLASGEYGVLDEVTMAGLHSRFRSRGVIFPMTDWLGNSFDVFIEMFRPWPRIKGGGPNGVVSLWDYEMELHVLTINTLVGTAFVDAS
jgi:hypothetical protein